VRVEDATPVLVRGSSYIIFARRECTWRDANLVRGRSQRRGLQIARPSIHRRPTLVMPVPDTGAPAAAGSPSASGLPYREGMYRNRLTPGGRYPAVGGPPHRAA